MKLDEQNKEHVALIAKYLANEMDENERANFEIDTALDPENAQLIANVKKEWIMLENSNRHKKIDTNAAWSKLSSRLEDENLIPNQPAAKSLGFVRLLSMSAAAVVVAAIGITLFWNVTRESKSPMVSVLNANSHNTVVETLTDGSIVYLADNTTLSFPEKFSQKDRLVELKGQAYFDVAHNPQKPFIIETADAYIQVLGTAFNVKSYAPDSFELIVQRGKVKVTLKADEQISQVVVAGEKIVIDQQHLVKNRWVDDGSLSWRMGKMQFKDETLQHIITVVNRNYHASIVVPDQETANRKLTVTFHENSLETITQLLCVAMNLHQDKVGNDIVLVANDAQ